MGTISSSRGFLPVLGLFWGSSALGQATTPTGSQAASEVVLEAPSGSLVRAPSIELKLQADSYIVLAKPPPLSEGVALVPSGSILLIIQDDGSMKTRLVEQKSFLLPEPMYDSARLKARQLQICEPALEAISTQTLALTERIYKTLETCGTQFEEDEKLVEDLTTQVRSLETRAVLAEDRLGQARKTSAVMSAITGGLVLGASTVLVVSLAE